MSGYSSGRLVGGTILRNTRSNSSPVSSAPSFRAVSLNRSDCSALVIFRLGFRFGGGFGSSAIPVRSLNESFGR